MIALLRCPENHQNLVLADPETLLKLNKSIARKQLSNRCGKLIEDQIEAGLVREDRQLLYPVKKGFPVMLLDEAIDLT